MPNTREKLIELLETVVSPNEVLCDGEVLVSTARVADHLIANGVTVQQWIPVTDRLPEANEKILICSIIGNQYVAQHLRGHFYVDGTTVATSHWMPLPEPPKGA